MDEEVKKVLENHEERIVKLEGLYRAKPVTVEKGMAIKEFMISKKPKSDVEKTLVIGYYLEKYQRLSSFNIKDLKNGFGQAKESIPDNLNDKVNMNIRKGHMAQAMEKKDDTTAWHLTSSGERFVENGLKGE